MDRIEVVDRGLQFAIPLENRPATNFLVIHHTGSGADIDASAEEIHGWHLNNGWAGIGYHYVVRKDGTVEQGRPHWTIGSHAYGKNSESIGIHLSGDFTEASPTEAQIESTALLIANLCTDYGLPIDRQHVFGHREVGESSCPGDVLFGMLDTIVGKANFYRYGPPEAQEKAWQEDLGKIQKELTNEERIWKFLKEVGLNDYAAAGVMGNLYAESGLSPTNLENYYESKLGMTDEEYTVAVDNGAYANFVHDSAGYGLAQWTYWSRKQGLLEMAQGKGVSIGDLDMQLEYLWQEMLGYHGMMVKLKAATSVQEASNAVLLDFERPADQSEAVQFARARMGQDFYDEYALTSRLGETEKEDEEMRYNTVDDVPEWAKPTIQKMIDKGLLGGGGNKDADGSPVDLDLSIDMIRMFVINDRAGVYDR